MNITNITSGDDGEVLGAGDGGLLSLIYGLTVFAFVLNMLIVLLGVPGNFLILVVFWTKPRRTSTTVFIMTLAAADLFACLVRICEVVHIAMQLGGSKQNVSFQLVITVGNNLCLTVAAAVTAMIAVDRYDCVCRHNKRLLDHRKACAVSAGLCFLSLIANIPLFLFSAGLGWDDVVIAKQVLFYSVDILVVLVCYGLVYAAIRKHVKVGAIRQHQLRDQSAFASQTETSNVLNPTRPDILQSSKMTGKPQEQMTSSSGEAAPSSSSPKINPQTRGISFKSNPEAQDTEATTSRRQESENKRSVQDAPETRKARSTSQATTPASLQRKTTRMLFLATVIFLLTYIPYWVFVGFRLTGRPRDKTFYVVYYLLYVLFLNNAINPLIYGIANRRFRKDVGDVLKKMCGRRP